MKQQIKDNLKEIEIPNKYQITALIQKYWKIVPNSLEVVKPYKED